MYVPGTQSAEEKSKLKVIVQPEVQGQGPLSTAWELGRVSRR